MYEDDGECNKVQSEMNREHIECDVCNFYMLKEHDRQIREKALDEFVEKVKDYDWRIGGIIQNNFIYDKLENLAKKLKEHK